jgi:serine/threonine-protein kinase
MAPEQFIDFKNSTQAADIYSAAATVYHMLAGKAPLPKQAETTRQYDMLISAVEDDRIPIRARRPDVPQALARLLDGLLMRSDSVRTAMTAGDVAGAIGAGAASI